MQDKFTIPEIINYINSEDLSAPISDLLGVTGEHIIKANENNPIKIYSKWLVDEFNVIAFESSNGEGMFDVDINKLSNLIIITFSIDGGDYGIHTGNEIEIEKMNGYSNIKIRLCDFICGRGIENQLEENIKRNLKELFKLELDE